MSLTAVKNAKAGQVRYRTDKNGIIHGAYWQASLLMLLHLQSANLEASDWLILNKAKPTSAKGIYLKKVTLTTSMGPGLSVGRV